MPQVRVIANVFDPEILERSSYFRRVIRRTVVHYQHFEIAVGLTEYGIDTFPKQMSIPVAGDDEAHGWSHKAFLPILIKGATSLFILSSRAAVRVGDLTSILVDKLSSSLG
jgi:hypothetical protein